MQSRKVFQECRIFDYIKQGIATTGIHVTDDMILSNINNAPACVKLIGPRPEICGTDAFHVTVVSITIDTSSRSMIRDELNE